MVDETNNPATQRITLKIVDFLVTTVLTGGSSSRESCLVTNLSPPSIQLIKGYSSHELFVVVFNCDKLVHQKKHKFAINKLTEYED